MTEQNTLWKVYQIKCSVITVKKQTHNFREGNAEVEETISILP